MFLPQELDLRIAIGRTAKFLEDYRAKQGNKQPASAGAEPAKGVVASPVDLAVDAD
ncbi:hypothetical protein D3C87_1587480 [compost metagenome]